MLASVSESHFGKNMSKIGHMSFNARNAPMQFGGPELSRSLSFPSKPHSGLRSEGIHELPTLGKYDTSRSSGMENDGEKWHARGNEVFEKGDMKSAEECYTRGIKSLASGETYQSSRYQSLLHCYSNRAAVRMSLGQIREALSDCLAASKIDPTFPKVQLQIANCLVAWGDHEGAIKQFNKCLESNNYEHLDPAILSEASSGLNKALELQDYISLAEDLMKLDSDQVLKALDLISDALSISSHSDRLMEMKANAMLKAIKSLPKNEKVDSDPMWMEVMGRIRKDSDHLFEMIGEAYAVLSDTSKRAKYDLDEEKRYTKKTRSAVGTPRKSAPRR